MVAYNPNIPSTGQTLGASRPQVQGNFQLLQTTIDQDHVDMNDAGPGKHKQITFNANNTPGGLPIDPSSIIFTKNNNAGHPYPFFLNSEAAAVANALPFLPDVKGGPNNFSFKIGKMIFNLGNAGVNTLGTTVAFDSPFTADNQIYTMLLGLDSTTGGITTFFHNLDKNGVKIFVSSGTLTVWYLAIGT